MHRLLLDKPLRRTPLAANLLGLGFWLVLGLGLAGCPMESGPGVDAGINSETGLPADSQIRIAHFTAGAPGFDVCLKGPSDSDFTGPIVRVQAKRPGGVPYANISAYIAVAPAAYTARVVPGTATNCAVSLGSLPDITVQALTGGHHYTVAGIGQLSNPATIKFSILEDDLTPQAGQVRWRFIHGAPGRTGLELGSGAAGTYTRLFSAPTYAAVGDGGNGAAYRVSPPQDLATNTLRDSGASTDLLSLMNKVTLKAGSVYTATAIGLVGNSFSPFELSLCDDTAPAASGLSSCQEIR